MRIAKLRPAVAVAWLFAFVLLNWIWVVPGFAQTTSCAPTGNCTSTDSLGNTYTFNAASISTTGSTVIPVAQRTPTGATQLASYTVSPSGSSGLFNASSVNAFGQGPVSYTINPQTLQQVSGNCGPVFGGGNFPPSPATAATASSAAQGTVRSQTLAVTTIVSDRVRAISRDIARGSAAGERGGQLG